VKNLMFAFLALSLALWVTAGSKASAQQSASQQSQTDQNQANRAQANSKAGQNMSGNVSSNGKNFVNDKNNKKYKVDNPDALKGHEGQHVAIIVHVDPDTGDLHIMQVEVPDQQ
jgi:hypothetical protein